MKTLLRGQLSAILRVGLCCVLLSAIFLMGCSLPNLEEPDCTKARDVVREFYSFHFGNDMRPTKENLKLREKYLTPDLLSRLLGTVGGDVTKDYFTDAEDLPKAFRVGECKVVAPAERVRFKVLLFWKNDFASEQKHIFATAKKVNDKWLIDDVAPLDK